MKISKEIYGFIVYELYHYEQYRKELELERERILESSANTPDGQPQGNKLSNIPLSKTIQLNESTAVLSLERRLSAIDKAIKRLTDIHRRIFTEIYCRDRSDTYRMCDELHISERTFQRFKSQIIQSVGIELGLIKMLA